MRRGLLFLGVFLAHAMQAFANDWGMGQANSKIDPANMFRPVSTPAHEISTIAIFTLAITTAIFVIVSGLLTYSVVRFRSRRGDDGSEPPQVYGSGPVEFAWTAVPVLIVFVLILTTARSVYTVQAARRPPGAVAVRVVGHQWWWEFQYPELGIVTANELHVPVSDPRDPPRPSSISSPPMSPTASGCPGSPGRPISSRTRRTSPGSKASQGFTPDMWH